MDVYSSSGFASLMVSTDGIKQLTRIANALIETAKTRLPILFWPALAISTFRSWRQ